MQMDWRQRDAFTKKEHSPEQQASARKTFVRCGTLLQGATEGDVGNILVPDPRILYLQHCNGRHKLAING